MLKHQVVISVNNGKKAVITRGKLSLRERFMNFLFGKQKTMFVVVPSETVESVAIRECVSGQKEGGENQDAC